MSDDWSENLDASTLGMIISTYNLILCIAYPLCNTMARPRAFHDWTYSPFVALYFAIERMSSGLPVVWCLNQQWLTEQPKKRVGDDLVNTRSCDKTRNENSFKSLFMGKQKILLGETPMQLHERLTIQQGSFLCPSTNNEPLMNILLSFDNWRERNNLAILKLPKNRAFREDALELLNRMNISQQTLFPGLDGFARSLWQKVSFFDRDQLDTI